MGRTTQGTCAVQEHRSLLGRDVLGGRVSRGRNSLTQHLSSIRVFVLVGQYAPFAQARRWHFSVAHLYVPLARLTFHLSISPPVYRNIAKQAFLETLQDNFIEMDTLATARRDGAFTDGYVA